MPIALHAVSIPLTPGVGYEQNKGQFLANILFAARPNAYITAHSLVFPPVTLQFEGANPAPAVSPSDPLPYTVNVFAGADSAKWITGIRRYSQVRFASVYPGVDLVYVFQPFLAFRFVIAPGAAASTIHLSYGGAVVLISPFSAGGTLIINLPNGRLGQNSTAWQDTPSGRVAVGVRYVVDTNAFSFALDSYDTTRPVTIESTLPFSAADFAAPKFQARSGALFGFGIESPLATLNTSGGCPTSVPAFPGCGHAMVSKWSAAGEPVWLSYMSGSSAENPASLDVDASGNVYVAGATTSADFPVTANAAQRNYAGPPPPNPAMIDQQVRGDAFLAKLDGTTGTLLYATYLGGASDDGAAEVRVDAAGNAYLGGPAGAGMPTTSGAFSATPCVKCAIAYIAKIDASGRLAYLTYLPASPSTFAIDRQGGVYFGGSAAGDLPVTPGALLSKPVHTRDPFVAKLKADGSGLAYATYYPAPAAYPDFATFVNSIAVDSNGNAWFGGPCSVNNTIGEADLRLHEYLAKLSADGSALIYSSQFIGGELAIDANDGLSIFTRSDAPQLLHTAGGRGTVTSACGLPVITKLDAGGTVRLNRPIAQSNATFTGFLTQDANLGYPGNQTIEIVPIAAGPLPDTACVLNAASIAVPNLVAPGEIVTIPGRAIGPPVGAIFQLDQQGRVPTIVSETRVLFDGAPAPVLYADDGQVNAIAPFGLTPGTQVSVTVEAQGRTAPPMTVTVQATQPGLFTRDGSGGGPVLAFNQDGSLNTTDNPAQLGSIVTLFANGTGITNPASVEGAVAPSIDARPVTQTPVVLEGAAAPVEILYYGPSPGSLTSITQINLRLPASLPQLFPLSAWPIVFNLNGPPPQQPTISLKQ